MSGPNPPGPDSEGSDIPGQEPGSQPTSDQPTRDVSGAPAPATSDTGDTEIHSQAYSAPESEQFTSGPYVPADSSLYDYDSYDPATELVDQQPPPRWPWVVGVAAIIAAIALVASVSVLVTRTDTDNLATPETTHHRATGARRDHHDDPTAAATPAATDDGAAAAATAGDRDRHPGAAAPASAAGAHRGAPPASGDRRGAPGAAPDHDDGRPRVRSPIR